MRIQITPSGNSPESADFAKMLTSAYFAWADKHGFEPVKLVDGSLNIPGASAGFLGLESGVHRLTRISPYDPQKRRTTTFVHVSVSGEQNFEQIRHYVTAPYKMAKDFRDRDNPTADVDAVLSGDLSHFYKQ